MPILRASRAVPILMLAATVLLHAQGNNTRVAPRQALPPDPSHDPNMDWPVDLVGQWVAAVTEDWDYRMKTPAKGDYTGVPLNAEGRKVADAWDPAKDEASGEACRVYGAAGLMRLPTRLHITWQDDQTLKLETDAGRQTRLFHFDGPKWTSGKPGMAR